MKSEEDFQFVNTGPSREQLQAFADFMKKGGFTWDDSFIIHEASS